NAKDGAREAGAAPMIFNTITVSDGISMGTDGMRYSLPSRDLIADSIETVVGAESLDALVTIGGCDKNIPGCMIAIANAEVPSVFVYGGTIKPGHLDGEDLNLVSVFEVLDSIIMAIFRQNNCKPSSVVHALVQAHAVVCTQPIRWHLLSKQWV